MLGHHAEAIESALKGLQSAEFSLARNARPDDGQGSSVLLGLRALPAHCDGVVIALADQPLINAADIAALTTAFAQRGSAQMVVPTRDGTPGNPVVIDASLRQEWQNLGADWVGHRWRKANPQRVHCLNTDNPNYFLDIDTPHDLERFAQTTGKTLLWPSQDA